MIHTMFSEINPLYASSAETPNTFRFTIRMTDPVEGELLCGAVETAMQRYPYFCVRLGKRDGEVVLEDNPLPVTVSPFHEYVVLNPDLRGLPPASSRPGRIHTF